MSNSWTDLYLNRKDRFKEMSEDSAVQLIMRKIGPKFIKTIITFCALTGS